MPCVGRRCPHGDALPAVGFADEVYVLGHGNHAHSSERVNDLASALGKEGRDFAHVTRGGYIPRQTTMQVSGSSVADTHFAVSAHSSRVGRAWVAYQIRRCLLLCRRDISMTKILWIFTLVSRLQSLRFVELRPLHFRAQEIEHDSAHHGVADLRRTWQRRCFLAADATCRRSLWDAHERYLSFAGHIGQNDSSKLVNQARCLRIAAACTAQPLVSIASPLAREGLCASAWRSGSWLAPSCLLQRSRVEAWDIVVCASSIGVCVCVCRREAHRAQARAPNAGWRRPRGLCRAAMVALAAVCSGGG